MTLGIVGIVVLGCVALYQTFAARAYSQSVGAYRELSALLASKLERAHAVHLEVSKSLLGAMEAMDRGNVKGLCSAFRSAAEALEKVNDDGAGKVKA